MQKKKRENKILNFIYKIYKYFINGFIVFSYWLYKIVFLPFKITKKIIISSKKSDNVIVIKGNNKKYKKQLKEEAKLKKISELEKEEIEKARKLEEAKLKKEEERLRLIEEKEERRIEKLKETVNHKSKADILLEKKFRLKKEKKYSESREEKEKNLMINKIEKRKKNLEELKEKDIKKYVKTLENQIDNYSNQIETINYKISNDNLEQKLIGELAIKRSKLEELIDKLEIKKKKQVEIIEKKFKKLFEKELLQEEKDKRNYYIKFHKEEYKLKQQALKEKEFIDEINERYSNSLKEKSKEDLSPKVDNTIKEITKENKKLSFFEKLFKNSVFEKQKESRRELSRQALLKNFENEDNIKSNVKLVYEYVAKNSEGKVVKDYFQAFSKIEVHSYLLSEGYTVYSIRTNKWIQFIHSGTGSTYSIKVKMSDVIFMCTQISTYIKSGIPLVDSIRILSRQYKKKSYQKLFSALMYDLTMGDSFSNALEKQGTAFPKLLINMVRASELTGELPEALDDMADYYTHTEATKKQMVTAMTYPIIVSVIALGVMVFIMMYVIPKFVDIYNSMDGIEIPPFTIAIISLSDWLKLNIFWLLLGIVAIALLIIYLYKNVTVIRTSLQWFTMHIPVIGNVIIYNEVTMFTKTFASLLKHNVFITDSMEILSKISNNEIYKALIYDTIYNLSKGEKISTAFKDQWAFPVAAYEMIVTGEKTGQLAEMMDKVSTYYQELHKNAVGRIKTFIEPIMIIGLTVATGVIVLAVIIPMFNMYSSLSALSQTE